MRRSHAETQGLIEARVADFVNGDASEDVLKASLKSLYLDADEIALEVWKAKVAKEKARTHVTVQRTP
jgi:hypothetical protein